MKTLSAVILSTVLATSAFGQEGPGRGEVTIKDITVNGSGCPVGSATAIVTNSHEDGPVDTGLVSFDSFVVEKPGKSRKFCTIAIDMKFPLGWSYAIVDTFIPGAAVIQEGVRAKVETSVAFRGTDAKGATKRSQKGHWEGTFNLQDRFDRPVWSPCGKVLPVNLKITTSLSGKAKQEGGPSVIQIGGEEPAQLFNIRWKRC